MLRSKWLLFLTRRPILEAIKSPSRNLLSLRWYSTIRLNGLAELVDCTRITPYAGADRDCAKLQSAFEPQQAEVLLEVISLSYNNLVKVSDFTELKAIVRDLAESQKSMGESQKSMGESLEALGIAQERTSTQLEEMTTVIKELALAQERTEKQVEKLTSATSDIRSEIGGMSRSMSYALENEAYRALPAFLLDKHGIEVTERLIRAPINNEEINFFGRAVRDGKPVLIVGESKQRLDERRSSKREENRIFSQLETKANIVRAAHPDEEIALLLITHYARPEFLRTAAERGIIVVQSFEW